MFFDDVLAVYEAMSDGIRLSFWVVGWIVSVIVVGHFFQCCWTYLASKYFVLFIEKNANLLKKIMDF